MPQNVTQYDLLISCPGDIVDELEIIENVVNRFNQQFTDILGISIRVKHWSKSGYAQSGDKPQNLLNKQFALNCDAAVAIFWTRFGTPTEGFGSGTEEEIENMLAMGKQVFMYFSEKPIPPAQIDREGYARIQEFKERYKERGIFYPYSNNEEFERLFWAHLSFHFLGEKRIADSKSQRNSVLILKGIDNQNKLNDDIVAQKFVFLTQKNREYYLKKIDLLYNNILRKKVDVPSKRIRYMAEMFPAVKLDTDKCEIIKTALTQLNYHLPEGFFNLGNLCCDILSTSLVNYQPKYQGTDEEIAKNELLNELYNTIISANGWHRYERAFNGKYVLRLALQNDGTNYDENIEVILKFPNKALLANTEFPKFSNATMELILNEYDLRELFGISDTAEYQDYSSSIKTRRFPNFEVINTHFSDTDYTESYEGTISDVFLYEIYTQDNFSILKLKVDYLKHHTSVAFPSVIFLKDLVDEVEYSISSQNNAEITRGKFKVIAGTTNP